MSTTLRDKLDAIWDSQTGVVKGHASLCSDVLANIRHAPVDVSWKAYDMASPYSNYLTMYGADAATNSLVELCLPVAMIDAGASIDELTAAHKTMAAFVSIYGVMEFRKILINQEATIDIIEDYVIRAASKGANANVDVIDQLGDSANNNASEINPDTVNEMMDGFDESQLSESQRGELQRTLTRLSKVN